MTDRTPDRTPESPGPLDLDQARTRARERLSGLRAERPDARLADAQHEIARELGHRGLARPGPRRRALPRRRTGRGAVGAGPPRHRRLLRRGP